MTAKAAAHARTETSTHLNTTHDLWISCQWTTADDLTHTPTLFPISLSPSLSGGACLFTFLSMRTVKTSRSRSGSRLRTRPWLNSCTGWFRWAVRLEFDKPISFPLRGCSSAAIFARAARCTTPSVVLRQWRVAFGQLAIGSLSIFVGINKCQCIDFSV